jgi:hypothetical protein
VVFILPDQFAYHSSDFAEEKCGSGLMDIKKRKNFLAGWQRPSNDEVKQS